MRAASDPGYGSSISTANSKSGDYSLPLEPLVLTKPDEMTLLQRISPSVRHHTMDVLKDIYNDISSVLDRDLTGWVQFPDIISVFDKNQVSALVDRSILWCMKRP